MHGAFKVILIVLCYAIISNSRPLPPIPGQLQKRLNPVRHYNSPQELTTISNDNLHDLRASGDRRAFANHLGLVSKTYDRNEMKRRGLDVGIRVNVPTPQQYDDSVLKKLEALANRLVEDQYNTKDNKDCPNCDEEVIVERTLKPAYECDEWDPKHRICILERNIGDTVTFYLSTGQEEGNQKFNITWKKEFHMRDSVKRKELILDPQNPPENIILGRRGFELRVSPLTETDMAYNMFSATLHKSKLNFMLRIVAIDLGFVYVGEAVELDLRKFVSLPAASISFKWYMEKEGERGTLPSNMKVSTTGSSIRISELRQEQEGILACSVYTNLDVLATKKRFLMKELSKNKDVLQSSPNHTLVFKEEFRMKRDPKKSLPYFSSLRLPRHKRARLAVDDVERALFLQTSTEKEISTDTTTRIRSNDYNPYIELPDDEPQAFVDNKNKFQEISDNFEDTDHFQGNKEVGKFANQNPMAVEEPVEGQRISYRSQPINEDLSLQAGVPVDQMNAPDNRPVMNQPDYKQMNAAGEFPNEPESGWVRKPQHYLMNKAPPKNVVNKIQSGPLLDISVNPPNKQQKPNVPQSANQNQGMQYTDLDVQAKGRKPNQQDEIILNIDGMKENLKTTAEIQIAKLISVCFSDLECSASAMCVRSSLKTPGFCKCLPGANGVGIFCREGVWLQV